MERTQEEVEAIALAVREAIDLINERGDRIADEVGATDLPKAIDTVLSYLTGLFFALGREMGQGLLRIAENSHSHDDIARTLILVPEHEHICARMVERGYRSAFDQFDGMEADEVIRSIFAAGEARRAAAEKMN
jgi:hypothetical protein